MKAQMFIVTMIFMVGLIFFVQQALFGYSSLDLSKPIYMDDYYTVENIVRGVDKTIAGSSTCREANEKISEFIDFVKRRLVKRGYELEGDYLLDCSQPFPPP